MDDYLTDDDIIAGSVEVDDFVGLVVGDTGVMHIVFTSVEDGHAFIYRRSINDVQASSLALSIQAVLG